MAAPVAEEDSLAVENSNPPLAKNYLGSPNSAEDYNIFSQLTKTFNTQHNDPDAPSLVPLISSRCMFFNFQCLLEISYLTLDLVVFRQSKRRKSKPTRFEVSPTEVQTERPPPKINIVRSCLSSTL